MGMYVGFLSEALRVRPKDWTREALVDNAVVARAAMLSSRLGRNPSAYDLLSADIAYDVSLILLCNDLGVTTGVAEFADPLTERDRIECELLQSWGLDLRGLARARRPTMCS